MLAPRFPSINQPWMDSYLEQLEACGIPFAIASTTARPGTYAEKVDRLRLLEKTVVVAPSISGSIRAVAEWMRDAPRAKARAALRVWKHAGAERVLRSRLGTTLRALEAHIVLTSLPRVRVIHAHSLDMAYDFLPGARLTTIPVVVTFHGLKPTGVPQTPQHRREVLFDYAQTVLVNTAFACDQVVELGCPPSKIQIVPQGLPLGDFPYVERGAPAPLHTLELLSVGRFHRDKGQAYSLGALRGILQRGIKAHWHFVGVGQGYQELQQIASRLGVAEHVTFHVGAGADELRSLYSRCHIFVLASVANDGVSEHVETQGVVLQEAQASGCIPIATRVGGIPECINDNVDGILVSDKSDEAIVEAVQFLFEHPEKWRLFQRAGRENVERRFSSEVIGKRIAEVLDEAGGPLTQRPYRLST